MSYKVISEAAKIGKKLIHDTHTQLRHITIEYVGTDDEVKEDGKEVSATVVFVTKLNAWLATRDSQPVLEFAVVVISNTDWGLFEGDEKVKRAVIDNALTRIDCSKGTLKKRPYDALVFSEVLQRNGRLHGDAAVNGGPDQESETPVRTGQRRPEGRGR